MLKEHLYDSVTIEATRPEHAAELEVLQRLVFPKLAEDEILHAAHYLKHLEIFPEGQLVALDGKKVIGGTTTMRRLAPT